MRDEIDEKQVEFVSLMLRRALSGLTTEVCEQCGDCSSSCPVSKHIEGFNPRLLIGKISLGRLEELLKKDVIWTCTSCLKCKERCPENISPYDALLILRTLAYRSGYDHPSGYDDFIEAVVENGIAQLPQTVRNRRNERVDRASLGLPPAQRPRDMKSFSEILRGLVR